MAVTTQDSRIILKSSTETGVVPFPGPSSDHTDGNWGETEVYAGEAMLNIIDNRAWFRSLYYTIGLATINGTAALASNRVCVTDASGHITTSITATELASLSSGSATLQTINITGLSTLTFNTVSGSRLQRILLTSTNPTESIDLFANAPADAPFRIYPEAGLTVTFIHDQNANQPHMKGSVNRTFAGNDEEWVEFDKNPITGMFNEVNRYEV